jgi:hypothetical protein
MDDKLMRASPIRRGLVALLLPLLLTACGSAWWLERTSFPEDRALARAAIADLVAGNRVAFARKLPAQIRPQLSAQFAPMRAGLPFNAITETKLVDAGWLSTRWASGLAYRDARLAYELSSGEQRALVQMIIRRQKGEATIVSFNVAKIDRPAREINAFRLADMSLANFLVTASAIAGFATMIIAIRRIWTSGLFRRRWLWIIGCLLGLFRISTMWGTSEVQFLPLQFTFFSAGFLRQGLGPWIVFTGIPVVAIWALLRHRALKPGAGDG